MVRINLQRFLKIAFIAVVTGVLIGVPIYNKNVDNNFNKPMAILGYDTKGGTPSNIGKFFASRFVIPEAGILNSISVYLYNNSGSAQNIQVGIYNDNAGAVGTKLISSATVSIPNGFDNWKTVNLSSDLSLGAAYWLSFQFESGLGGMWLYYDSGDENQTVYTTTWDFGTWPDNPAGLTYYPAKISVYATYTPVFPSAYTWGLLGKSQIDPEKIEEAINRLVAEHEADPDSHLGEGEALQSHRAAEIIDHVVGSVVPDKFSSKNSFFNIPINASTDHNADNYSFIYPGFITEIDQNSPLVDDMSDFLQSFPLSDYFYNNGDIVCDVIFRGLGASGTWAAKFDLTFAMIEIKSGYYRFHYYDGAWHQTDWVALSVQYPHRWRIHYSALDSKLNFYINGELVSSLDYTITFPGTALEIYIWLNRGTSASSSVYFGDIRLAFDTTLI